MRVAAFTVLVCASLAIGCRPSGAGDSDESGPTKAEEPPAPEEPPEPPPSEPEAPPSEPEAPLNPEPPAESKKPPAPAEPEDHPGFVEDPLVHTLPPVPRGGAFESKEALLSEKMGRRIRSKLRLEHGVMVLLHERIVVAGADGGVHVVGLYGYSLLDACVAAKGGGSEARSTCIQQENLDGRDLVGKQAYEIPACTWRGLVHAHFGPAPEGKAEYGGPLSIVARRELFGACLLQSVDTFRLHDADADEKAELEVLVTTTEPNQDFRAQDIELPEYRSIGWYEGSTLAPQYERRLSYEGIMQTANNEGSSDIRHAFVDANGDGAPDLRFVGYDCSDVLEGGCMPPNEDWTALNFIETQSKALAADLAEVDIEFSEVLVDQTLLYDAELDSWVAPETSP